MRSAALEMDERAVAVNHTAGYYAYLVMCWMLLLDMMLRSVRPGWTDWRGFPVDVVAVVAGGALTHLGYTLKNRTVGRWRGVTIAASFLGAGLLAALVGVVLLHRAR